MRPRVKLTEDQLKQVAELRDLGQAWTVIGRELGVHRQIVKREFMDWKAAAPVEVPLPDIRQEALKETFHYHTDMLLSLAGELSNQLERLTSTWQPDVCGADVFQPVLGSTRALPGMGDESKPAARSPRHRRQRRWLYDALSEHLGDSEWSVLLQAWAEAYDLRAAIFKRLEEHARASMFARLSKQWGMAYEEAPPVEPLATEIGAIAWAAAKDAQGRSGSSSDPQERWAEAADVFAQSAGSVEVVEESGEWALHVAGRSAVLSVGSEQSASLLKQALEDGLADVQDEFQGIADEFFSSQEDIDRSLDELLKLLDPLNLRPMLLKTRCYLCPL